VDSNITRVAQRARQSAHRHIFEAVIEAYKDTRNLHPIQSCRWDETARQGRTLGPQAIDFLVDVERACTAALQSAPELHATFARIIAEEPTDAKLTAQVMGRCGRVFASRKLLPHDYFRTIRTGRIERRAA